MTLILSNKENSNKNNDKINNLLNIYNQNENQNENENENNIYNTEKLNNIKTIIEQMDKIHHIEILKILINEDLKYNENNNGTFINLTELDYNILIKLENYIDYFKKQQSQLVNLEEEKKKIESSFF